MAVHDLNLYLQKLLHALFEKHAVQQKMSSFHFKLMSLEIHRCSICLESFPKLTMAAAGSTECRRCNQDKHIPKLYSTANNMNPGVSLVPRLSLFFFQLSTHSKVNLLYTQNSLFALERKEKAWSPKFTATMTSFTCGCWNFCG